jgi:hypothetical protein
MRMTNDEVCRPARVWELGLYDAVGAHVDPLVLGVGEQDGTWGLLMRDASEEFLEGGATPIALERQQAFLRDMAGMHAATWGFQHAEGLATAADYYGLFNPSSLAKEAARGPLTGVPSYVSGGRAVLAEAVPAVFADLEVIEADLDRFGRALAETPRALVHGDWKGGNLGSRPDGRTVLVDWAFPSAGAALADIAWYLGCNCDRLVTSKERVIDDYRTELERAGIDTSGWWERQLELALLGGLLILGWSKAGDPSELGWWVDRTAHVARELAR